MMSAAENINLDEDYETRQWSRDEQYCQEYTDWIDSLSPEELQRVEQFGLDHPSVPGAGTGGLTRDMAESPLASHDPTKALDDDSSADPEREQLNDLLRRLVGELMGHDNARLSLECLSLVTGLAYCGDSMTEIAKHHNITRAAVSKRCRELTTALGLKPSRAMRSEKARESHRRARLKHLKDHS
jgi:hypothetical protein